MYEMSKKVVKSKQAALTEAGKLLANAKDDFALAFDQIKNIIFAVKGLPAWKNDKGLLEFRRLVGGVVRAKDPEKRRRYIEGQVKPWKKIYEAFKDNILAGEFHYLLENDIVVVTGKPQKARLQLSKVYEQLIRDDKDSDVAGLEAYLCFLFLHLSKKGSKDRLKMQEVCSEYELEEDQAAAETIGNIVQQVRGKMGGMAANPDNIGSIVQGIFEGGNMQQMGKLAQDLLSGKMDIPSLVSTVTRQVNDTDDGTDGNEEEGSDGSEENEDLD